MSQIPEKPGNSQSSKSDSNLNKNKSTAKDLLKFAGTWHGDDLEECLEEVYKARGENTLS
ncbi:MAG: hypothetical protein PVH61_39310 [Candidatus Aminicenantes bacterium]|jgi:hypothetical protein